MNKNKKTKMEFSKKIFYIVITLFVIVIAYSMALMWRTCTTDGLAYLIPSIGTIAATAIGFYYWKAKAENAIKLSKEYEMSLDKIKETEQNFNDFNVENNMM